jgi:hypothetical protein
MNQHELQKCLIRYQGEIEQLGFWLSRAKQSLPEDFEGYRRSLQDASGLAERLACGIRDIRVETCFSPGRRCFVKPPKHRTFWWKRRKAGTVSLCRGCCPRRRPVPAPSSPGRRPALPG